MTWNAIVMSLSAEVRRLLGFQTAFAAVEINIEIV